MPAALPPPATRRSILRTARVTAKELGEFVRSRHKPSPRPAMRKGEGDFVTKTDIAAERRARKLLLAAHPEHGFLGEETEPVRADADFVWVIDPIDGTSNFTQGLPQYAVSIACLHRGRPLAAAVHAEPDGGLYAAARGLGATRNGRKLRTPPHRLGDASVIGAQWHRGRRRGLEFVARVADTGARIRVIGSTVVELCDVATGRLHANVQEQGRVWDFAAAALIVTEAGSRFTGWEGEPIFPIDDLQADAHYPSIAAPPALHRELVRTLCDLDTVSSA